MIQETTTTNVDRRSNTVSDTLLVGVASTDVRCDEGARTPEYTPQKNLLTVTLQLPHIYLPLTRHLLYIYLYLAFTSHLRYIHPPFTSHLLNIYFTSTFHLHNIYFGWVTERGIASTEQATIESNTNWRKRVTQSLKSSYTALK